MNKTTTIIVAVLVAAISFLLFFDYGKSYYPNEVYNVYLDGELLGTILSKEELETYIDNKSDHYINKLKIVGNNCVTNSSQSNWDLEEEEIITDFDDECYEKVTTDGDYVDTVYTPSGLQVDKVFTYTSEISTIDDIYNKIQERKPFTVRGFQFTLKQDEQEMQVYVLNKDIFDQAVESLYEIYLGEDIYHNYKNKEQREIETTGTYIEKVYLEADITVKEKQISVDEVIYTDSLELTQYLLFGYAPKTDKYTVKQGEMISDIAFNNKISVKEFLISNPNFTNANNLVKPGSEVNIKETNPQLKVVVIQTVIEDKVSNYKTTYKYDSTKTVGYSAVEREGEDGLERVNQRQKLVNGTISYVEPKGKEVLKTAVDEVIVKGDKKVYNIGDLSTWGWMSESGWSISDDYGWRIHPITGIRHLHAAIDIAGTGYGSKIFAVNNGTIETREYHYSYGYYIVINHNNGYYTVYAHMSRFADGLQVGSTVERGQIIGYVGSTGYSTGPHIHFEVWVGKRHNPINPWEIYR